MRKTKIVCTMGPNTNSKEMMKKLVENGMDVARFNFSHGDHEEQKMRMDLLKEVRKELKVPVAILLDTKGPEIRTGELKDHKKVTLKENQTFVLTTSEVEGDNERVSITYKGLPQDVTAGGDPDRRRPDLFGSAGNHRDRDCLPRDQWRRAGREKRYQCAECIDQASEPDRKR